MAKLLPQDHHVITVNRVAAASFAVAAMDAKNGLSSVFGRHDLAKSYGFPSQPRNLVGFQRVSSYSRDFGPIGTLPFDNQHDVQRAIRAIGFIPDVKSLKVKFFALGSG